AARDHLCRRPARQRGGGAQGLGPRCRPHDRPCPAGQRDEGPVCAAGQAPAARLPRLLEDRAPRPLALPHSSAYPPDRHHRGPEDLHHGQAARRHPQAGGHPRPAPCLRHALARSPHRRPRHGATPAGPPTHLHHDALLPSQPRAHHRDPLPPRSAQAARRRVAVLSAPAPAEARRSARGSAVELADIFRPYGAAYRQTHPLSRAQRRAMQAIETCRTAALGGHRDTCDRCGAVQISYNSCRNRHCPQCQPLAKERWLEARRADLLPVEYFHVVFTLPHTLNPLAQGNPRLIYTLLFHAVAATLTTFARDPRHLGGDLGGTAILHTWGQNLSQHLHLHCVVTGGALAPDGARWISAPPGFLFPVRALAVVFRAKYLDALRRAFAKDQLV